MKNFTPGINKQLFIVLDPNEQLRIQLFRQRLSHKSVKAYATTPKAIMGNGGFMIA